MTVADLIRELSALPAHLPVAGHMSVPEIDETGYATDAEVLEIGGVRGVDFQGRYVAIDCDGPGV